MSVEVSELQDPKNIRQESAHSYMLKQLSLTRDSTKKI